MDVTAMKRGSMNRKATRNILEQCKLRIGLLVVTVLFCLPLFAFTVVIDAGHGGHDPGALGSIAQEKNLNLSVSKQLAKLIEKQYPDMKVLLTRSTDVFLTLQERADFVNRNNADLFICIHTNSADNKAVCGAETFTLGLDKRESNLDVAMRENSVMMLEDDYQTKYQGFDPNSVESYIMFEFLQDQYIDKSLQFASLVQQEFSGTLQRADRGVRQAAFWVLHKSACPSVLVEMGFISNREEEKYLVSPKGQQEIVQAIFDAFVAYKAQIDRKETRNNVSTAAVEADTVKRADKQPTMPVKAEENTEQGKADSIAMPVFRVQIFSVTAPLKNNDPSFKGLRNCTYKKDGRFYKYMYGEERDYRSVVELRKQLMAKFPDCFIVAFLNDEQILVKDAIKMIDNTKKQ